MNKFAIIETGGKQYKVFAGQKIKVEKLNVETGSGFVFDKILLFADGDAVKIGTPYVAGEKIEAKILRNGRERKKIVFKYHSKTRYKKKKGHRQNFTEVLVEKI